MLFNHSLKEIKVKDDTLVAIIEHRNHNGSIEVATGNSVIEKGDRILIITKSKNMAQVDDILE